MMWRGPGMIGGHFGGGGIIGMILCFLLFALIIAAIITFIVKLASKGGHYHGQCHNYYHGENKSGALDILKERYAKGEITKEQYDNMKKDLELN